jgi:hypothetical protein
MTDDRASAELLIRISDRLVDNVNTLAHVVGRGPQESAVVVDDHRVHP